MNFITNYKPFKIAYSRSRVSENIYFFSHPKVITLDYVMYNKQNIVSTGINHIIFVRNTVLLLLLTGISF